jgi:hypothetical protein
MIPKLSSDAATAGLPIGPAMVSSGAHARRNSESKASTSVPETILSAVSQPLQSQNQDAADDAVASNAADSSLDLPDAQAADAIMTSLRAGILAQPGTAMLAQGGLSPQSVFDLLQ